MTLHRSPIQQHQWGAPTGHQQQRQFRHHIQLSAGLVGNFQATESSVANNYTTVALVPPTYPQLNITRSGNEVIVSWPTSVTGWTLQTNLSLSTGIWGNYTGNTSNNSATNSLPNGNLFFRRNPALKSVCAVRRIRI